METYGFTNNFLLKNNEPFFPVMGEIHYSRCPRRQWKTSLLKMKAGGVSIVSTYVIWIHHEEVEGAYDFAGNKNLREFVSAVSDCGMKMMLRIGPWCHGEVRNGGFPDWLMEKGFQVRSNDEAYIEQVEKFYRVIYAQVHDFLFDEKTGAGAIIGVQIENEFGHCGGLTGAEGERHMTCLAELARKTGFNVPFYTATGWGGAVTGGMIPMMGGYCESPWDQRITEIEPSGNYIFTHERNDHDIGSDFGFGAGITFDISKFPYLTAELGGGLQVTRHRRPVAYAEDIGAMSLVKLGSGVNLLGYYMYHGGTNPQGRLTTLQESKESGSLNDLPELSYDFRAAVREYGQLSPTFREIKLLAMFIRDFGSDLCTLPADIPPDNPLKPDNVSDLRYSYRHDGNRGYVFVNNYQRRKKMAGHGQVELPVPGKANAGRTLPPMDIADGDYFFLPFNMRIGGALLKSAEVTPLCIIRRDLEGEKPVYVFYTRRERVPGEEGLFCFEGNCDVPVLVLSRTDALNAWIVSMQDGEHLVVSDSAVIQDAGEFRWQCFGRKRAALTAYPPFKDAPEGFTKTAELVPVRAAAGVPIVGGASYVETRFADKVSARRVSARRVFPSVRLPHRDKSGEAYSSSDDAVVYALSTGVDASLLSGNVCELFLRIAYEGESARLYSGDVLLADNLYIGKTRSESGILCGEPVPYWEVGLGRFIAEGIDVSALTLEIMPLGSDSPIFLEQRPVDDGCPVARLTDVCVEAEYCIMR